MPSPDTRAILKAIRERDPDGNPDKEPTDADYKAFEQWVIDTYGYEILAQYFEVWDG